MDRLKAILADKILDLTSLGGDDVKIKIDRMQRFRDFANACQTLMTKYPQIEDELIKMVQDGDFDTKVASSRVDSVIRLADQNKIITDNVPEPIIPESVTESIEQEEVPQYLPEDIDYEEVSVTDNDPSKEYVSYTDVDDSSQSDGDSTTVDNDVLQSSAVENLNLSEEEQASIKRKATIRKVMQIIGIILAVIILIIIIKFVIKHWVVILSIVGGLAIIAIIVWFVKNKKS